MAPFVILRGTSVEQGDVALVKGASRGIEACALSPAASGYDVVITPRTLRAGDQREHSATLKRSLISRIPSSLEKTGALIEDYAVARSGLKQICSISQLSRERQRPLYARARRGDLRIERRSVEEWTRKRSRGCQRRTTQCATADRGRREGLWTVQGTAWPRIRSKASVSPVRSEDAQSTYDLSLTKGSYDRGSERTSRRYSSERRQPAKDV